MQGGAQLSWKTTGLHLRARSSNCVQLLLTVLLPRKTLLRDSPRLLKKNLPFFYIEFFLSGKTFSDGKRFKT
jgi:hypothetical protein